MDIFQTRVQPIVDKPFLSPDDGDYGSQANYPEDEDLPLENYASLKKRMAKDYAAVVVEKISDKSNHYAKSIKTFVNYLSKIHGYLHKLSDNFEGELNIPSPIEFRDKVQAVVPSSDEYKKSFMASPEDEHAAFLAKENNLIFLCQKRDLLETLADYTKRLTHVKNSIVDEVEGYRGAEKAITAAEEQIKSQIQAYNEQHEKVETLRKQRLEFEDIHGIARENAEPQIEALDAELIHSDAILERRKKNVSSSETAIATLQEHREEALLNLRDKLIEIYAHLDELRLAFGEALAPEPVTYEELVRFIKDEWTIEEGTVEAMEISAKSQMRAEHIDICLKNILQSVKEGRNIDKTLDQFSTHQLTFYLKEVLSSSGPSRKSLEFVQELTAEAIAASTIDFGGMSYEDAKKLYDIHHGNAKLFFKKACDLDCTPKQKKHCYFYAMVVYAHGYNALRQNGYSLKDPRELEKSRRKQRQQQKTERAKKRAERNRKKRNR